MVELCSYDANVYWLLLLMVFHLPLTIWLSLVLCGLSVFDWCLPLLSLSYWQSPGRPVVLALANLTSGLQTVACCPELSRRVALCAVDFLDSLRFWCFQRFRQCGFCWSRRRRLKGNGIRNAWVLGWMGSETTGLLGIPSGFNCQRRFLTSCPEYIRPPSLSTTTVSPDKIVIYSFSFFYTMLRLLSRYRGFFL